MLALDYLETVAQPGLKGWKDLPAAAAKHSVITKECAGRLLLLMLVPASS